MGKGPSRLLWDPFQGLWNQALLGTLSRRIPSRFVFRLCAAVILRLDTVLLVLRALRRRVSMVGWSGLFGVHTSRTILYFDLGTHEDGHELAFMVDHVLPRLCDSYRAWGFEANARLFKRVRDRFADRDDVALVHRCVCLDPPAGGTIRFYNDPGGSELGGSIYRTREGYDDVPAVRFSDWLRQTVRNDLEESISLLRMNIEGAEFDVVRDLTREDLADRIDGWFGMWDDVSKIDEEAGEQFLALARANDIARFTFNGRDMGSTARKWAITYEVGTRVAAADRLASGEG